MQWAKACVVARTNIHVKRTGASSTERRAPPHARHHHPAASPTAQPLPFPPKRTHTVITFAQCRARAHSEQHVYLPERQLVQVCYLGGSLLRESVCAALACAAAAKRHFGTAWAPAKITPKTPPNRPRNARKGAEKGRSRAIHGGGPCRGLSRGFRSGDGQGRRVTCAAAKQKGIAPCQQHH